jgi:hypothetical protein
MAMGLMHVTQTLVTYAACTMYITRVRAANALRFK